MKSASENISPSAQQVKLLRNVTRAAVAVAVILIACKTIAYWFTGSVALLSTLIDSVLDALASTVNLIAVRHALTPADTEHRFGHGKAEPLAGLAQSAFIAGSAVFLAFEAGGRLFEPRPVMHLDIGVLVMGISIVLTTALVIYQKYVVSQTKSVAISADHLHYLGDLLVNGSVLISLLLLSQLDLPLLDPLLGLAIALYILFTAWRIAMTSMDQLMDRELADNERDRIVQLTLRQSGVLGLHDLRTRQSGPNLFIQLHLDLDANMALRDAHTIAEQVEASIQQAFPQAEIIIHQDPSEQDGIAPLPNAPANP